MKSNVNLSDLGSCSRRTTAQKKTKRYSEKEMKNILDELFGLMTDAIHNTLGVVSITQKISDNFLFIQTINREKFMISFEKSVTSAKLMLYKYEKGDGSPETKKFVCCVPPVLEDIIKRIGENLPLTNEINDVKLKVNGIV